MEAALGQNGTTSSYNKEALTVRVRTSCFNETECGRPLPKRERDEDALRGLSNVTNTRPIDELVYVVPMTRR